MTSPARRSSRCARRWTRARATPAILTLMGEAHERDGSRELAGERYALAVEVSGNGVQESLRYARYLIADNRLDPAAAVLEDALRVSPQMSPC